MQARPMPNPQDEQTSSSEQGSIGWCDEEYEEESVRGVHPSYLKFSKRLLQRPDQCVRCVSCITRSVQMYFTG
jgi:hypothetical protein